MSMSNVCQNCGAPLEDNEKFCTNCGAPVTLSSWQPVQGAESMNLMQGRQGMNPVQGGPAQDGTVGKPLPATKLKEKGIAVVTAFAVMAVVALLLILCFCKPGYVLKIFDKGDGKEIQASASKEEKKEDKSDKDTKEKDNGGQEVYDAEAVWGPEGI